MILILQTQTLPTLDSLATAIRERPALRDTTIHLVTLPLEPGEALKRAIQDALKAHTPDLIFTYTPITFQLLKESNTRKTPVVFISVVSLQATGFADAAGNRLPGLEHVAGLSIYAPAHPKHIETLRNAFPRVKRVGVLVDEFFDHKAVEEAMRGFPDLEAVYVSSRRDEPVDGVHSRIMHARADAWYFPQTAYLQDNYKALLPKLRAAKVRGLYGWHFGAMNGGALAMQAAVLDRDKRSAEQIELILTGTPPSQIAVETATVLRLSGNMAALRELGDGFDVRTLRYIDIFF